MLLRMRCHWRSAHWPKMFVANMPVSSRPLTSTTTPRPRICRRLPSIVWAGPHDTTDCTAVMTLKNTPSIRPSTEFSTQMVMASGIHTSRPASRYFFKGFLGGRTGRAGRPQASDLGVDGAGAGDAGAGPGAGDAAAGADEAAGAGAEEPPSAGAGVLPALLLPPLKSGTYPPDPLSWKPAAVTCFLQASAPQFGHAVRTGSEIFCSTSFAWPQASQR